MLWIIEGIRRRETVASALAYASDRFFVRVNSPAKACREVEGVTNSIFF